MRSVNRLLAEVSDRQRRLLEVLAERAVVSLKEIAEEMGEPEATVTGVLGSLGNRTKDYRIVDDAGNPTWPFYIEWDPLRKAFVYLMPRQVAEVVKTGSRRNASRPNL